MSIRRVDRRNKDVNDDGGMKIDIPTSISIRDLMFIIPAIVSVVAAWGLHGTRIALAEDKIVSIEKELVAQKQLIGDNYTRLQQIERDNLDRVSRDCVKMQQEIDALSERNYHTEQTLILLEQKRGR